jgi:hypothetical protein
MGTNVTKSIINIRGKRMVEDVRRGWDIRANGGSM